MHFPEEHIPDGRPGRKPIPTRRVLEAVLWILNTGAQWHMHGSHASRDRLIELAEKHVTELFEHRAEKFRKYYAPAGVPNAERPTAWLAVSG